jgi:hypothetical protein
MMWGGEPVDDRLNDLCSEGRRNMSTDEKKREGREREREMREGEEIREEEEEPERRRGGMIRASVLSGTVTITITITITTHWGSVHPFPPVMVIGDIY